MNGIIVSISCITYNHEQYIADAIESFLMQKTSFNYEILIHDDCSTDRTAEIIKDYEKKYPDIIKPIYQTENQYYKGIKVGEINSDRAKGKYIALCEGDDYWTDPYKLQKQIDFLEKNPDYSLCVHAATIIDARTNEEIYDVRPSKISRSFCTEEIILGGGGIFATNSMVYRREESALKPDFYNNAPIGDYPLMIFLSLIGKVYYIDECMSTYRHAVAGSWTERNFNNIEKHTRHLETIEKTIVKNKFYLLLDQGKIQEVKKGELLDFYNDLSKKEKLKIHLNKYAPNLLKIFFRIKKVIF